MAFEQYWKRKVRASPKLLSEESSNMVISVASFQNELRKAFRAGQQNVKVGEKAAAEFAKVGKPANVWDFFSGMGDVFRRDK